MGFWGNFEIGPFLVPVGMPLTRHPPPDRPNPPKIGGFGLAHEVSLGTFYQGAASGEKHATDCIGVPDHPRVGERGTGGDNAARYTAFGIHFRARAALRRSHRRR